MSRGGAAPGAIAPDGRECGRGRFRPTHFGNASTTLLPLAAPRLYNVVNRAAERPHKPLTTVVSAARSGVARDTASSAAQRLTHRPAMPDARRTACRHLAKERPAHDDPASIPYPRRGLSDRRHRHAGSFRLLEVGDHERRG